VSEIVKVQLPLLPPDSIDALIYAKGGKRAVQDTVSPELLKKMNGAYKAFFFAVWTGKRWSIGELAPNQSW
jgi:hypothetical protein